MLRQYQSELLFDVFVYTTFFPALLWGTSIFIDENYIKNKTAKKILIFCQKYMLFIAISGIITSKMLGYR